MRAAPVALAILCAFAGCAGFDVTTTSPLQRTPTSSPTDAAAASTTETTTVGDGSTATPTAIPTSPADPSADNPWGQAVVPVTVNDTVGDGRNTTAIVAEAVAYWNAKMGRYTDYGFRFRLTDDTSAARVEVRFADRIDECDGPTNHTAGCARLIGPDETAADLEVATVVSDGSNAFVTGTTKHEFGHLLGLDHDAEPRFLMAQNSTTPVRNASDRANPWYSDTLRVAVEYDRLQGDRATIDDQVGHAVRYYDDGAAGTVPGNVTVARTDLAHTAEVLVTNDPDTCDVDGRSQFGLQGQNSDRDGAMEAYANATVCVDVDDEAVGWHVGYWLGAAFGLSIDELAPPFRDASYRERRSEWWT